MSVRDGNIGDMNAVISLWNGIAPTVRLFYPVPPGSTALKEVPNWNALIFNSMIVSPQRMRVSIAQNTIRGFLVTSRSADAKLERAFIWAVLQGGAVRTRFRASMKELLTAWFTDAQTGGVAFCVGTYPKAGSADARELLNQMTEANGAQPQEINPRGEPDPAWMGYKITPAQGLVAMQAIVP